jgi:dolichol-phosphate mannosyltransferase
MPPRFRQFIVFGAVGGFGTVLNSAVLWLMHSVVGLHYLAGAAIATEVAIISNFLGNEHLTFARGDHDGSRWSRFRRFQMVSLGTVAGTLTLLWLLVQLVGERYVLACNVVAIGTMFIVNFMVNRSLTWRDRGIAPGVTRVG